MKVTETIWNYLKVLSMKVQSVKYESTVSEILSSPKIFNDFSLQGISTALQQMARPLIHPRPTTNNVSIVIVFRVRNKKRTRVYSTVLKKTEIRH